MRRWNGWGDAGYVYHLPQKGADFLEGELGPGNPPRDVSLAEAVSRVPPSRLPAHPLISADPEDRLRHAAGQSLPDWIALRSGTAPAYPDGVAYPATGEHVKEIFSYAERTGALVIPYGGGTSVVGHLSAPPGERPVLSVDLSRMNRLIHLDENGCLATFGAGVAGPDLEKALQANGFTLGHYPQSFEYSTLGGWVATRSAGQFSMAYGKIERLFAGGTLQTPRGALVLPPFPGSAAGPDLREVVLGSEGRLGILTDATVRITRLPEKESFHAAFFPGPEQGLAAARELAQAALPLAMVRLSLPAETITNLTMAGSPKLVELLKKYLAFRGVKDGMCMLIYGAAGSGKKVGWCLRRVREMIGDYRGIAVGARPGKEWFQNRFRAPYLRNTLWEKGYAVDTLETAVTWAKAPGTVEAVEGALKNGLRESGEKVFGFTHLSHVYPHGTSIYTTYLYRLAADPAETLKRWQALKSAASAAIVCCGGTISHQHGVGEDHRPYLEAEKGTLGLEMIRSLCRTLDPGQMMNPGKLVL